MSYDNPDRRTYVLSAHDFGAGAGSASVRGPKGKKGVLIDYGVQNVSETFNAVATPATIAVGDGSDVDAFGEEFSLATVAAGSGRSVQSVYESDGIYNENVIVNRHIPADTDVTLTFVAPTGGTPAGIAQPYVTIDWSR